MYLKQRLFGLLLMLGFAGLTYYNWHQLWQEQKYSLKMATMGPLGVIGGFSILMFPTLINKPNTKQEKVIVILVCVASLAAGLINWYLMDPGFFGM
jgi:hypothetical protein